MDTLGEDLVLLSIRPDNGTIATKSRLGYGLRGSELVRLAATGRVGITGDRIVVLDGQPTGDEQLDAALASLAQARRPPRPKTWVGHPGSQIVNTYLARLAATGAIRPERGTVLAFVPVVRWRIADSARAADARARLDAIARATGPVDTAQAAFAGLASASGLGPVLYPGWANRQLRQRLERIAKGELTQAARRGSDSASDSRHGRGGPGRRPVRHRRRRPVRHRRRHGRRDPGGHPRRRVGRGPRGAPCGVRWGPRRARRRRWWRAPLAGHRLRPGPGRSGAHFTDQARTSQIRCALH